MRPPNNWLASQEGASNCCSCWWLSGLLVSRCFGEPSMLAYLHTDVAHCMLQQGLQQHELESVSLSGAVTVHGW